MMVRPGRKCETGLQIHCTCTPRHVTTLPLVRMFPLDPPEKHWTHNRPENGAYCETFFAPVTQKKKELVKKHPVTCHMEEASRKTTPAEESMPDPHHALQSVALIQQTLPCFRTPSSQLGWDVDQSVGERHRRSVEISGFLHHCDQVAMCSCSPPHCLRIPRLHHIG